MKRWGLGTIVCLVFALSASLGVLPASAADLLPDLGMAQLSDVRVEKLPDGRQLLRYTTVIVNVGAGPFELRGHRTDTTTGMTATQRVYDGGGARDVSTTATLVYGGDGHNHWHVRDLESAELIRLDNGAKVGTGAKRGFCFFDNRPHRLTLPGAPQSAVYPGSGCGTSSSLDVTMGLSIGWGDAYLWDLPDQYVDITGLAAGRYRLQVTADKAGTFMESNLANNTTWVDLQLKGKGQPRILAYGPSA